MASVKLYNMKGDEIGTIDLNDEIFSAPVSEHLLHKVVVAQLANRRQGTQKAKTRSEVRGGGRKPWRQKGTGHARQGSIRSPQWAGGGVVFAPKPRDYSKKMNKKERRAALFSVLTDKVNTSDLIALDELKFDEIKTKSFVKVLNNLKADDALVVIAESDKNIYCSGRNLSDVKIITTDCINTYDILRYKKLIATKDALKKIEEVYA